LIVVALVAISILLFDTEQSGKTVPYLTKTFALLTGVSICGRLMTKIEPGIGIRGRDCVCRISVSAATDSRV
jgi:hypothetical protein